MPQRSRPLQGDWSRVARFKWELIKRDPEGAEILKLCREASERFERGDKLAWQNFPEDYNDRLNALHTKYHIRPTDDSILKTSDPVAWGTNFGFHPEMAVSLDAEGKLKRIPFRPSPTPVLMSRKDPPTLGVAVYLTEITRWDLDRLARWFKDRIKKCLAALPKNSPGDPPELAFLRTVSEKQFAKDLRRYDMRMEKRLTFSEIALFEIAKKTGRISSLTEFLKVCPRPTGRAKGESSVRASVHRIFKAIYRRPYRAGLHHMDTVGLSFAGRRRIPATGPWRAGGGRQVAKIRPSAWEKSTD